MGSRVQAHPVDVPPPGRMHVRRRPTRHQPDRLHARAERPDRDRLLREEAGLRATRSRSARSRFFLYEKTEKAQYVEEYAQAPARRVRAATRRCSSRPREVDAGWRFIDPIVRGVGTTGPSRSSSTRRTAPRSSSGAARPSVACDGRATGRWGWPGLGKMGAGLARNLVDHGWRGRRLEPHARRWPQAMAGRGARCPPTRCATSSPRSRRRASVWLMVPAGAPVDELLFGADGAARARRAARTRRHRHRRRQLALHATLPPRPSGSPSSASTSSTAARAAARRARATGRCLMIGGDRDGLRRRSSRCSPTSPCPGGYRFFDGHGAGHFVKMVHNGIEYGMMQAIAEGFAAAMHERPVRPRPRGGRRRLPARERRRVAARGVARGGVRGARRRPGGRERGRGPHRRGRVDGARRREAGVEVPVIEGSLRFRIATEHTPATRARCSPRCATRSVDTGWDLLEDPVPRTRLGRFARWRAAEPSQGSLGREGA